MTPENFMKAELARLAYTEAADMGGSNGMLAVACVLRNRVRKGWQGGDWMRVIHAAPDVSPYEPTAPAEPDLTSSDFRRVLQEVDDIFTGMFDDTLTAGGLYYLDALYLERGRALSPWFSEKVVRDGVNHPRIAQVGSLYIFS